jgi:hypothetical protein
MTAVRFGGLNWQLQLDSNRSPMHRAKMLDEASFTRGLDRQLHSWHTAY